MMCRNKVLRGNILFLILLAVVLFAALSYAVTSSMRGGGKSANEESAKSVAAALTSYAVLMQNEFQRFLLTKNYNFNQIDLINPGSEVFVNLGDNSACTTTDCNFYNFFNPVHIPESAVDRNSGIPSSFFNVPGGYPKASITVRGVNNVGTSEPEIIIGWPAIKTSVCEQINLLHNVRTTAQAHYMQGSGSASTDFQQFQNYVPNLTPPSSPTNWTANGSGSYIFCSEREKSGIGYPASPNTLYVVLYPR